MSTLTLLFIQNLIFVKNIYILERKEFIVKKILGIVLIGIAAMNFDCLGTVSNTPQQTLKDSVDVVSVNWAWLHQRDSLETVVKLKDDTIATLRGNYQNLPFFNTPRTK
jgi:hypothetical protein